MTERPRVLVLLEHYLPGHKAGGPPRTVAAMVERLSDRFSFFVATRDRDFGDDARYPGLAAEPWHTVGEAQVRYLVPGALGIRSIARLADEVAPDIVYMNSIFSPVFTSQPLLLRRLGRLRTGAVLAPRGELAPGALAIKQAKKRPFLAATRVAGLYRELVWQASKPDEAREIRAQFGPRVRVVVARDLGLSRAAAPVAGDPKASGRLRVVFLSRVSRMKNLDGALRILRRVRGEVALDVYGPLEDRGYWAECTKLMEALPANIRVEYRGGVANEQVASVLGRYDLFLLPTRGENYGHAIVEALCASCPVLVSDQTPWTGLARRGVGWDLPLEDEEGFAAQIERMVAMGPADHAYMRAAAAAYGAAIVEDQDAVLSNVEVLETALKAPRW